MVYSVSSTVISGGMSGLHVYVLMAAVLAFAVALPNGSSAAQPSSGGRPSGARWIASRSLGKNSSPHPIARSASTVVVVYPITQATVPQNLGTSATEACVVVAPSAVATRSRMVPQTRDVSSLNASPTPVPILAPPINEEWVEDEGEEDEEEDDLGETEDGEDEEDEKEETASSPAPSPRIRPDPLGIFIDGLVDQWNEFSFLWFYMRCVFHHPCKTMVAMVLVWAALIRLALALPLHKPLIWCTKVKQLAKPPAAIWSIRSYMSVVYVVERITVAYHADPSVPHSAVTHTGLPKPLVINGNHTELRKHVGQHVDPHGIANEDALVYRSDSDAEDGVVVFFADKDVSAIIGMGLAVKGGVITAAHVAIQLATVAMAGHTIHYSPALRTIEPGTKLFTIDPTTLKDGSAITYNPMFQEVTPLDIAFIKCPHIESRCKGKEKPRFDHAISAIATVFFYRDNHNGGLDLHYSVGRVSPARNTKTGQQVQGMATHRAFSANSMSGCPLFTTKGVIAFNAGCRDDQMRAQTARQAIRFLESFRIMKSGKIVDVPYGGYKSEEPTASASPIIGESVDPHGPNDYTHRDVNIRRNTNRQTRGPGSVSRATSSSYSSTPTGGSSSSVDPQAGMDEADFIDEEYHRTRHCLRDDFSDESRSERSSEWDEANEEWYYETVHGDGYVPSNPYGHKPFARKRLTIAPRGSLHNVAKCTTIIEEGNDTALLSDVETPHAIYNMASCDNDDDSVSPDDSVSAHGDPDVQATDAVSEAPPSQAPDGPIVVHWNLIFPSVDSSLPLPADLVGAPVDPTVLNFIAEVIATAGEGAIVVSGQLGDREQRAIGFALATHNVCAVTGLRGEDFVFTAKAVGGINADEPHEEVDRPDFKTGRTSDDEPYQVTFRCKGSVTGLANSISACGLLLPKSMSPRYFTKVKETTSVIGLDDHSAITTTVASLVDIVYGSLKIRRPPGLSRSGRGSDSVATTYISTAGSRRPQRGSGQSAVSLPAAPLVSV